MSKRRYQSKATKDFLVLALVFFLLCIWAIKDAWFPSDKVLKKHPQAVSMEFTMDGFIQKVHVSEGDFVGEDAVLAELNVAKITEAFEQQKKEYSAKKKEFRLMQKAQENSAINGASESSMAEREARQQQLANQLNELQDEINKLRSQIEEFELIAPKKGTIIKLNKMDNMFVQAGETVMVLEPSDSFYLFNKSLAVFSFFAFWIFLGLHIVAH